MGHLKTKISRYGNGKAFPIPTKIMGLFGEINDKFDIELNVEQGKIILTKETGGKKNE